MAVNVTRLIRRPDKRHSATRTILRLVSLMPLVIASALPASPQARDMKAKVTAAAAGSRLDGTDRTALERFGKEVQELQSVLGFPGLSVAIVKDQQLLWAEGFGYADLEKRTAATMDTPYAIASVTKPVAATLLLQLVEQGLVNLDEPARKYSAAFKDDSVKIRHLLTHTSEGTPGEKYAYNGDRFRELTQAIEKASGKPFRQVIAQQILDKLGMSRSVPGHDVLDERDQLADALGAGTPARYEATLASFAKPYMVASGRAELADYPLRGLNAAAGLITTAVDLAKFDIALDRQTLLTKGTLDKAWAPAMSSAGHTLPYGLGWFVQRHQGSKLVWHYGYWQQFSALYLKVPEKNVTLIVLANSNGLSAPFGLGDGDVLASPFACSFLQNFAFQRPSGRAPAVSWRAPPEIDGRAKSTTREPTCQRARVALADWVVKDDRRPVAVDPAVYDSYVGQYVLRRPGLFDTQIIVTKDQNKLVGSFSGELTGPQNRFELTPESSTRFFWKGEAVTFTFTPGVTGRVTHLIWNEFGQERRLPKVR